MRMSVLTMATASQSSLRSFFSLLIIAAALFFTTTTTVAEIRFTEIRPDDRPTIPLDLFGFTHSGRLDLNVSQISLSYPYPNLKPDLSQVGFFLCTRDSWFDVIDQLSLGNVACPLQSDLIKSVFTFDKLQTADRFDTSFVVSDANEFTLVFGNCVPSFKVSMNVRSAMYNFDAKTGRRDYLSTGETILPGIYFLLFLIYSSLAGIWIYVIYSKRLTVFRIHFFMLVVAILKPFNLLCEAEDKSYIKRTGSAHGWDVLFYIFSFLKGITVFTLIVLIRAGWLSLKPHLQDKEKKVLMIVIRLQVITNVAIAVVIDEAVPFSRDSYTWFKVVLLVDVISCCAVLFPIVGSIKNLREVAKTDRKAALKLMKLTLFKQYYIVVICYIYFKHVVSALFYSLWTITSYRYQWTRVVAAELATLAFYVFTGYIFRPKVHNPYFALDEEEEEPAAAEELKIKDEF